MTINGPDTKLLGRLLEATELRARVLASNIANTSTPGYKRQEVEFEDLLRNALSKGSADFQAITPEVHTDYDTPSRPDGNNVTLELELNAMRENRLLYETYSAMLAGQYRLIEHAITGGV